MESKFHINCTGLYKIFKVSDLEVVALRGVDLSINYGELLSIVGASGSGKSTLLNILAGYESPSAGDVNVGEFDLLGINQKEAVDYRKKEVGFVWQQTGKNLVPYLDISSNIELPMMSSDLSAKERKLRVEELIEFFNLGSISFRLPENISGGEQQISAIAVALANQPPFLLADEPTGELDDETSDIVLDKMRYVNSELFNGYWIEEENGKVILKSTFKHKCLGYERFYTLGYKKYGEMFEIPKKIKNKIMLPNNFVYSRYCFCCYRSPTSK